MNRIEWAKYTTMALEEHGNKRVSISVNTLHLLIMAALIASSDKKQQEQIRGEFCSLAGNLSAYLSFIIPAFEKVYADIPFAHKDNEGTELQDEVKYFSELINAVLEQRERLEWTIERFRDELLKRYGKKSIQLLTDEELADCLTYLESL